MISQREILILFLIKEVRWNIWKLIQQFDRADFPGNVGPSIDILYTNELIETNEKLMENNHPLNYKLLEKGELFLKENFNPERVLNHIQNMTKPDFLYEIVKTLISESKVD